jgi:biopolymer transport protein ExbB
MSNPNVKPEKAAGSSKFNALFASILIPVSLGIGVLVFIFILGDPANFENGDPAGHPIPGNYLGMMHKGGLMVPILMASMIIVIAVMIERAISLGIASGKGSIPVFVRKIKVLLDREDIKGAIKECDGQRGSVGNVIREGLNKYEMMASTPGMEKEQKMLAIQKEIEEATALELPMLEKNLVILATFASVATLLGLFGTVLGMIKAFSALATAGAPDAVALSTGIAEALINTALGIGTSALAIISYNYFTTKIDGLTYGIDEAGYSIAQNFAAKH